MYRTAVIRMYDVLDQVHVNAVVTEYPETPGTVPPVEIVLATTIPGTGTENVYRWLWEGLSALAGEAAAQ